MFSQELEEIIDAALADGTLTDKERAILHRRAVAEGVDTDELDLILDGRLAKIKKQEEWLLSAPPQNLPNQKLGNVVKCPSCGSQVIGGTALCPKCGYTFSNVSANSSTKQLQDKLETFNRRQEDRYDNRSVLGNLAHSISKAVGKDGVCKSKMDIIATFPVPNTRADLLEFLTMLQARADATGPRNGQNMNREEDLSYAYWLLYTNCINKANLSFSNDNDFQPYFQMYGKQLKKTKGIIGYLKCNPRMRTLLIVVIFYMVLFGVVFFKIHK